MLKLLTALLLLLLLMLLPFLLLLLLGKHVPGKLYGTCSSRLLLLLFHGSLSSSSFLFYSTTAISSSVRTRIAVNLHNQGLPRIIERFKFCDHIIPTYIDETTSTRYTYCCSLLLSVVVHKRQMKKTAIKAICAWYISVLQQQ